MADSIVADIKIPHNCTQGSSHHTQWREKRRSFISFLVLEGKKKKIDLQISFSVDLFINFLVKFSPAFVLKTTTATCDKNLW